MKIETVMKKLEKKTGTDVSLSDDGIRFVFRKKGEPLAVRVPFRVADIGEEGFVDDIASQYFEAYDAAPSHLKVDASSLAEPDFILRNVIPCLVSRDYLDRYEDTYYEEFVDLVVVYRVRVDFGAENNDGMHSFLVTNSFIRNAGLNLEKLRKSAFENVAGDVVIDKLSRIMGFAEPKQGPTIYVMTNKTGVFGASAIVDTRNIVKVCALLGCDDIQIIPSSIHEVLIVPYEYKLPNEAIADINMETVKPNDVLSNHAYRFCDGAIYVC